MKSEDEKNKEVEEERKLGAIRKRRLDSSKSKRKRNCDNMVIPGSNVPSNLLDSLNLNHSRSTRSAKSDIVIRLPIADIIGADNRASKSA